MILRLFNPDGTEMKWWYKYPTIPVLTIPPSQHPASHQILFLQNCCHFPHIVVLLESSWNCDNFQNIQQPFQSRPSSSQQPTLVRVEAKVDKIRTFIINFLADFLTGFSTKYGFLISEYRPMVAIMLELYQPDTGEYTMMCSWRDKCVK